MTIKEASKRYKIPLDILKEYRALGLVKGAAEDWECDDQDLETLNLLILLHESGFGHDEVKGYIKATADGKGSIPKRIQMLNRKREEMLEEIHSKEGQLDRLDYLRYELQKQITKQ